MSGQLKMVISPIDNRSIDISFIPARVVGLLAPLSRWCLVSSNKIENTSMSVYFFPRTGGTLIEYLFVNIIIVFGYLVAYEIQFIVESAFYSVWFGIQGKGP